MRLASLKCGWLSGRFTRQPFLDYRLHHHHKVLA